MYVKKSFNTAGYQVWFDTHLRWNPSDYGGNRRIVMFANQIWLPDIVVMNRCVTSHT